MCQFLRYLLPGFLVLGLLSACNLPAAQTPSDPPPDEVGQPTPSLSRAGAQEYAADFQMQFSGNSGWSYGTTTLQSNGLRETNLHLDGLPPAQNPGDIRLVTDGAQSWMTGPGTGGECVQFPNQHGLDPTFLYPASLVSLQEVGGKLQLVGEAAADGLTPGSKTTLLHFHAAGITSGPWKNAAIDIWQEKDSGLLRRFNMQAEGEDPFFQAGPGKLAASYQTGPLGDLAIQPVAGCEISVRLPETAVYIVRLPGMASFESPQSAQEIQQFYQTVMPQDNWSETAPAEQVEGAIVLSYARGAEEIQIAIESTPSGGSLVKVIFLQG